VHGLRTLTLQQLPPEGSRDCAESCGDSVLVTDTPSTAKLPQQTQSKHQVTCEVMLLQPRHRMLLGCCGAAHWSAVKSPVAAAQVSKLSAPTLLRSLVPQVPSAGCDSRPFARCFKSCTVCCCCAYAAHRSAKRWGAHRGLRSHNLSSCCHTASSGACSSNKQPPYMSHNCKLGSSAAGAFTSRVRSIYVLGEGHQETPFQKGNRHILFSAAVHSSLTRCCLVRYISSAGSSLGNIC
jgi:hypothetical protein